MLDKKLNILIAYPYFKDSLKYIDNRDPDSYRLIIDSGAFSAYNCGLNVTLDDYCKFLKQIRYERFEAAVQLDVVFNPEETKLNLIKMRDLGFKVNPVFTRGDDFEYFDKLIEDKEYIFVGGVQGLGSIPRIFAKKCLERSKGSKVHYLAFVRPDWLNHYKPYSCDSSTWSSGARFGKLSIYSGNGRIFTYERKDFINKPDSETIELLKSLGLNMNELKNLSKQNAWKNIMYDKFDKSFKDSSGFIIFVSILSYIKYSISAQNKIGSKIYMAIGDKTYLKYFFYAYDFMIERGVI